MAFRTHGDFSLLTVEIASGESESGAFDIGGSLVVGIFTDSTMTGAGISFKASRTLTGTFLEVYNEDTEVEIASAADRAIGLAAGNADAVSAFRFLKLVSTDGAGAAENEGADRTLYVVLKT